MPRLRLVFESCFAAIDRSITEPDRHGRPAGTVATPLRTRTSRMTRASTRSSTRARRSLIARSRGRRFRAESTGRRAPGSFLVASLSGIRRLGGILGSADVHISGVEGGRGIDPGACPRRRAAVPAWVATGRGESVACGPVAGDTDGRSTLARLGVALRLDALAVGCCCWAARFAGIGVFASSAMRRAKWFRLDGRLCRWHSGRRRVRRWLARRGRQRSPSESPAPVLPRREIPAPPWASWQRPGTPTLTGAANASRLRSHNGRLLVLLMRSGRRSLIGIGIPAWPNGDTAQPYAPDVNRLREHD